MNTPDPLPEFLNGSALIRRLLSNLASEKKSRGGTALWSVVGKLFCVGSTTASEICTVYGHDPETKVRKP